MLEKEERRWLVIITVLLLSITSIPYLIGYFRQGVDWHFTGFIFGVEDGNSYIAKMLSGSFGSWLFRSPYSTMPQKGVLAFLPYLLLGKLAFPPEIHDQLVALFQIFRWAAGGILVPSVYIFSGLFLTSRTHKKLATLIIVVGGGLGWLGWLLMPGQGTWILPLEVYSPEAFGFLSLLGLPHLAAARAFLLFGLYFYLIDCESTGWKRNAIRGGLCWFIVGFFQPLTIAVGYAILACHIVIVFLAMKHNRWENSLPLIKKAMVMGIIASPWVFYNFFFFASDTYLKAWYAQNIISSPPIQDYLWSYGLFIAASIPAVLHILKSHNRKNMILMAWVLCAALLAYFPYNVQRRFIDGVWIALVLLIFIAIELLNQKRLLMFYRILLGTTMIAPLLVMLVVSQGVLTVSTPVYRPAGEVKMFNELIKISNPGDIFLASYETGNPLPAWVPGFVLTGHGPESANLKEVLPLVKSFYSGEKDIDWQRDFIKQNGIDFILYGPTEHKLGSWEAKYGMKYQVVYDIEDYQVYKVETSDGDQ